MNYNNILKFIITHYYSKLKESNFDFKGYYKIDQKLKKNDTNYIILTYSHPIGLSTLQIQLLENKLSSVYGELCRSVSQKYNCDIVIFNKKDMNKQSKSGSIFYFMSYKFKKITIK